MAGVDVGSEGGKRRATNSEINMIPFIDLLMVMIAFLLITAVWSNYSRINANAQIPGPPDPDKEMIKDTPEKVLHVKVREGEFELVWSQGATTVSQTTVPRKAVEVQGATRFPDLATKLQEEWKAQGGHRDATDMKLDQAVLHTDNSAKFSDIIAVMDAIYASRREMKIGGATQMVPAFNMTFAVR
jgi:biopolymer transport protein ExbD